MRFLPSTHRLFYKSLKKQPVGSERRTWTAVRSLFPPPVAPRSRYSYYVNGKFSLPRRLFHTFISLLLQFLLISRIITERSLSSKSCVCFDHRAVTRGLTPGHFVEQFGIKNDWSRGKSRKKESFCCFQVNRKRRTNCWSRHWIFIRYLGSSRDHDAVRVDLNGRQRRRILNEVDG